LKADSDLEDEEQRQQNAAYETARSDAMQARLQRLEQKI
jgi:hypothetical protein